jgi:hypothetical protein
MRCHILGVLPGLVNRIVRIPCSVLDRACGRKVFRLRKCSASRSSYSAQDNTVMMLNELDYYPQDDNVMMLDELDYYP